MSRAAALLLLGCAATAPASFRRTEQARLIGRLRSSVTHSQRCDAVAEAIARCASWGLEPEDCGVDFFEERQGELGCGLTDRDAAP